MNKMKRWNPYKKKISYKEQIAHKKSLLDFAESSDNNEVEKKEQ